MRTPFDPRLEKLRDVRHPDRSVDHDDGTRHKVARSVLRRPRRSFERADLDARERPAKRRRKRGGDPALAWAKYARSFGPAFATRMALDFHGLASGAASDLERAWRARGAWAPPGTWGEALLTSRAG